MVVVIAFIKAHPLYAVSTVNSDEDSDSGNDIEISVSITVCMKIVTTPLKAVRIQAAIYITVSKTVNV